MPPSKLPTPLESFPLRSPTAPFLYAHTHCSQSSSFSQHSLLPFFLKSSQQPSVVSSSRSQSPFLNLSARILPLSSLFSSPTRCSTFEIPSPNTHCFLPLCHELLLPISLSLPSLQPTVSSSQPPLPFLPPSSQTSHLSLPFHFSNAHCFLPRLRRSLSFPPSHTRFSLLELPRSHAFLPTFFRLQLASHPLFQSPLRPNIASVSLFQSPGRHGGASSSALLCLSSPLSLSVHLYSKSPTATNEPPSVVLLRTNTKLHFEILPSPSLPSIKSSSGSFVAQPFFLGYHPSKSLHCLLALHAHSHSPCFTFKPIRRTSPRRLPFLFVSDSFTASLSPFFFSQTFPGSLLSISHLLFN